MEFDSMYGGVPTPKSQESERFVADRLKQLDEHVFWLLKGNFLSTPQYLGKHFVQPTEGHWLALGKKITELVLAETGLKGRDAREVSVEQAAKCAQAIVLCSQSPQVTLDEVRTYWAKADAALRGAQS